MLSMFGLTKKPKAGKSTEAKNSHRLKMGLGDMIRRVLTLESARRVGAATDDERAQLDLLMQALNEIQIPLQASCRPGEDLNMNGVPDTVEFFSIMSKTDCCVLDSSVPEKVAPTKSGGRV